MKPLNQVSSNASEPAWGAKSLAGLAWLHVYGVGGSARCISDFSLLRRARLAGCEAGLQVALQHSRITSPSFKGACTTMRQSFLANPNKVCLLAADLILGPVWPSCPAVGPQYGPTKFTTRRQDGKHAAHPQLHIHTV